LLAKGLHFEELYFGSNLYQMNEDAVSWRLQTPMALMPRDQWPDLLALYTHAEQPLRYYARIVGMTASLAYRDSDAVRELLRDKLDLTEPIYGGPQYGWSRRMKARVPWLPRCTFEAEETALQRAALQALVHDMARLADLVLPDRRRDDPACANGWRKFNAHVTAVTRDAPRTVLVNLSQPGGTGYTDFRDSVHLSAKGKKKQTELLKKKLAKLKASGAT
jgi:hypothetical protein